MDLPSGILENLNLTQLGKTTTADKYRHLGRYCKTATQVNGSHTKWKDCSVNARFVARYSTLLCGRDMDSSGISGMVKKLSVMRRISSTTSKPPKDQAVARLQTWTEPRNLHPCCQSEVVVAHARTRPRRHEMSPVHRHGHLALAIVVADNRCHLSTDMVLATSSTSDITCSPTWPCSRDTQHRLGLRNRSPNGQAALAMRTGWSVEYLIQWKELWARIQHSEVNG